MSKTQKSVNRIYGGHLDHKVWEGLGNAVAVIRLYESLGP